MRAGQLAACSGCPSGVTVLRVPIGYLIFTALMAAVSVSALLRWRPSRSSPFRLSYAFGFLLNWPLAVLLLLAVSTALAIIQNGVGSPVFWSGVGFAILASACLAVLAGRARATGQVVDRALDDGLGPGWRDELRRQASARRHRVERIANVRYGPAGRRNLLDVYRDRSDSSGRPVLVYLHPGAFRFGSKRLGALRLLHRLASRGWVCVSANYRLLPPERPEPLIDVKMAIAWIREHAREYGADPSAVFVAGSSAGGYLASLAALTANDPEFQPGLEGADTSVAGAILLYGYYGHVEVNSTAPPIFVAHGDQDTLVIVEDARRFVEQVRTASSNPVVYAELPAAQHGFDMFRSRRFDTVIDAIEVFASLSAGVFAHS
jgi:acetyl esterase/lipase